MTASGQERGDRVVEVGCRGLDEASLGGRAQRQDLAIREGEGVQEWDLHRGWGAWVGGDQGGYCIHREC